MFENALTTSKIMTDRIAQNKIGAVESIIDGSERTFQASQKLSLSLNVALPKNSSRNANTKHIAKILPYHATSL